MATESKTMAAATTAQYPISRIIFSSAAGTMIEWYDFYIFGSLTTTIAGKFYQTGTALGDTLAWLAAFAIGFIVRPFGALVFGRIGDLIGRKYTFLVTMSLMGICTFLVGLLPTAQDIGPAAGVILIILRILQGLALGGEYGGAATYIAEHSPAGKRGLYTSWIQITATVGLFLSLFVILATRQSMSSADFSSYGWRIPFLVSIFLIAISLYIRLSLKESPLFQRLKDTKTVSKNPITESFGNPYNLRWVLLALFGATMGQGVVWYTGQFYALFYLQTVFKVSLIDSNLIIGGALLLGTPLFVFFGWLSDRIGRKWIMLSGMALAVLTYIPIYQTMQQFAPWIGNDGKTVNPGYSPVMLGFFVFLQVIYVTMAYGPIAAFLVELFPTKIRYTSMSLPYHIGNGVFGGLVPIIGLTLISSATDPKQANFLTPLVQPFGSFAGLLYPMLIAGICFIVGALFIKETNQVDIADASTSTAVMHEAASSGAGK